MDSNTKPVYGFTPFVVKDPTDILKNFYVVMPISNSPRYKVRAENYKKARAVCEAAGVKLITVECAFGERDFEVTQRDNPMHVQLRSVDELWLKENMINIGINYIMQIDPDAGQIMWQDSDCFPMSPPREYYEEVFHQLQHYEFVQCWKYLQDFGPDYQPIGKVQMSFMATYEANGFQVPNEKTLKRGALRDDMVVRANNKLEYAGKYGAPGLAWAANISAIKKVGGLIDWTILGAGDWHMALSLVSGHQPVRNDGKPLTAYLQKIYDWQVRAERWIKRDVGYVNTTMGHWFHGSKVGRQYGTRGQILVDCDYQPDQDIKRDAQGLYVLETWEERQIRLRDLIRYYFGSRNEDSVPLR
jgi:hypothetical protein